VPITIHTSPAIASSTPSSVTTASFTPVAGGLLVAMLSGSSDAQPVVSGGGLTWTRQVRQNTGGSQFYADIWTAPVSSASPMTVSASLGGSFNAMGLKVDVISGQHPINPIGQTGTGTTSTNNATVTGYESSTDGSRGFCSAVEGEGLGTPTSSDQGFGWFVNVSGFFPNAGLAVRKAADTANSGTTVTFNLDASGSSTADWRWAALEILPEPPLRPASPRMPATAVHRAASW